VLAVRDARDVEHWWREDAGLRPARGRASVRRRSRDVLDMDIDLGGYRDAHDHQCGVGMMSPARRTRAVLALTAVLVAGAGSAASAHHGSDVDCGYLRHHEDAQEHLNAHPGDHDGPDPDHDGIACESLHLPNRPPTQASTTPAEPSPSDTAAIEAYILEVYADLFARTPDADGLAQWTSRLQRGVPYGEVAHGITSSAEFRSGLIRGAYQQYLGRGADEQGVQHWLGQMGRGLHIEQMQGLFSSSPESSIRAGYDDRQWIVNLYQNVLGRAPGSGEVDHWQRRLQAGTSYYGVALGFLYSTEHLTSVVDGYYVQLLHRNIDPAGAHTWVTAIQQGGRDEAIIASIVSSVEYRQDVSP
jgi:Domain of unknown function (DUF4214)